MLNSSSSAASRCVSSFFLTFFNATSRSRSAWVISSRPSCIPKVWGCQDDISTLLKGDIITLLPHDEDRKTTPLEDVVDNMRRVLSIKPAQLPSGRIATFVISCESPDKFKAQSVVRELVVKFIERTSRHRGVSRHPLRR